MAATPSSLDSGAAGIKPEAESRALFAPGTVLDVFKYQGAGNDFVVLDGRLPGQPWPDWTQAQVARLCDRHFGIGADGLIILQPPKQEGTAFHMAYYNADGCLSSFCGNGARCATAFAQALGLLEARDAHPPQARFTAADGLHHAAVLDDGRVRLAMADVDGLRRDGEAYVLDTGSPHWVQFTEQPPAELLAMDFHAFARTVRYGPAYAAEGINVNVVVATPDGLHMRTYERGVENETLSCGTGVTAAALAYAERSRLSGEGRVQVWTQGGELEVEFRNAKGNFTQVHLIGPAVRVFEGRYTA